jgi:hypothetical protein
MLGKLACFVLQMIYLASNQFAGWDVFGDISLAEIIGDEMDQFVYCRILMSPWIFC